ncbi:MAG: hypothetical protein LiPW15_118 [Parcubacteria group bacterium LiPW_15]|nr:MAG: hypothetical protein LiPW15_118 [Parcubacteria group bacterium LiPW_15]
MPWNVNFELREEDKKHLERFAGKLGLDWRGVTMMGLALAEVIQEKVVEQRQAICLKGEAYGPLEGIMIHPWSSEDESAKPLAKVLAYRPKTQKRAP